ncbi:MAG: Holliday junction resolvase RuvX [Planctomycetes bacterium]|nr:Holliday junction resolvase RuvX [Planctomycetota bacterium]
MIGRVLAIDYGGKRTGLAISDALGITAQPIKAVVSTSLDVTVEAIAIFAKQREVQTVVVGMPFLPDGSEGAQVDRVRHFLSSLRAKLADGVNVVEIDERHTTKEAEAMWRQAGYSKRKAKEYIDSTVAVILLREYLTRLG